jgi:hypothetical protein
MTQSQQFSGNSYGPESSAYGTEAVAYANLHVVQSCELSEENGIIYQMGLGEGLNIINSYLGPYSSSGSLTYEPIDFDFLKHFVGPKTGSGTSGSPYLLTDATDFSTSDLVSFSFERANITESTKSVEVQTGCLGTSFTISGELNKAISVSASWVGQKILERTTYATFTQTSSSSYIMLAGSVKWGATPSAVSGVKSFNISHTNVFNPDDSRSIESRFIGSPHLGARQIKFRFFVLMAQALAATIITNFKGGGLTPNTGSSSVVPTADLELKIEVVNGSSYATIWYDRCSIDKLTRAVNVGGGLVMLGVEGTARNGKDNTPIKWWTV